MKRFWILLAMLVVTLCLVGTVLATPATLTPQDISAASPIAPAFTSVVTDGLKFTNNGRVALYITNGNVTTTTVTVVTPAEFFGFAVADLTFTVGPGASKVAGPFLPNVYNDAAGYVTLTASPFTTVTVCALRY